MIGHRDGKMAAAHPEVLRELAEVLSEGTIETGGYAGGYESGSRFGFRMITYRMKEAYCTTGQNLPSLASKRSFNPVLMGGASIGELGVATGDLVTISIGCGSLDGVVEETDTLEPGVIAVSHGWGDPSDPRGVREKGCNVQRLIPADLHYDRETGLALQSAVPVNVSAVAS